MNIEHTNIDWIHIPISYLLKSPANIGSFVLYLTLAFDLSYQINSRYFTG